MIDTSDPLLKGLTKEEKKIALKYKEIAKQIIEIAETLNGWGYGWEGRAIDGHTPITMAAQCQNVPMMKWLIDKNVSIREPLIEKKNRNFLHFLVQVIIDFGVQGVQQPKELLEVIFKNYSHNDDLFLLAQQKDSRGFTPYHFALCCSLNVAFKKWGLSRDKFELFIDNFCSIHKFMIKIGHRFGEEVPQDRVY